MISVITSTYNRSAKLEKCIKSVIAQTYPDWEMIVVDDCSSDDTEKIVKTYQLLDTRIKYIKLAVNFGNDTRPKNIGVAASKGEYIAFLDDDNQYRPDHLSALLKALEDNPELDGVYGDRFTYIDGKPNKIGNHNDFDPYMLFGINYIDTSDVLIKRECIFDLGGFDEDYKKFVDWNLWVRMVKCGKRLKRVPLVITDYYIDGSNKSNRIEDTIDNKPAWTPLDCKARLDYLGKKEEPRIAIFSLTYNRLDYTKKCFESLYNTAGQAFEHFVVDNGSQDGTVEYLKKTYPNIHLIENEDNKGISIASNQALEAIGDGFEIIIKVDNDCFFKTKGWLAKMVEVWKVFPHLALSCYVEGLVHNPGGAPRIEYFVIGNELIGATKHLGGICHFCDAKGYKKTQSSSYAKADFRWDEDTFLHGVQDMEFSQHLNKEGFLMGYLENWYCEHYEGTEGQHKRYPEYFEKRVSEKTQKYEKNR